MRLLSCIVGLPDLRLAGWIGGACVAELFVSSKECSITVDELLGEITGECGGQ